MAVIQLPKNKWVILLVVVLILEAGCISWLGMKYKSLNDSINNFGQSIAHISQSMFKTNADVGNALMDQRVVVDPVGFVVYMPEFRIKLPYDETTKSLAYSLRDYDKTGKKASVDYHSAEADITSTQYIAPPHVTTMDCGNLVRIKVEDKANPYSPHEKSSSVKLSDGRTLQIYQFINDKECQQSWDYSVSPSTVADAFRQAQSY